MAEPINRIKFTPGRQRFFIESLEKTISLSEMAIVCKKSERTIRDWRREKYLIDEKSVKLLCSKCALPFPDSKKIDRYWYTKIGAKLGGDAIKKKYGKPQVNNTYRKQQWLKWWEKEGRYKIGSLKINKPKHSSKLAEFVGIMIGDGGITESQIQISISSLVDIDYITFVQKLIQDLFNVRASVVFPTSTNVARIVVSRKQLVDYCQKIGLKKGNKLKQGLKLPAWIFNNIEYQKFCLRGIMDTDGCVYNENHKIKNKKYSYKRLNIKSASNDLIKDLNKIMIALKFNPKIRNKSIQLENKNDIYRYFKEVGTNNPKHLQRYLL